MNTPQRGFTLIELMIVVAVVGILAAIAMPAYTDYVRKARRSDAMAALQAIQLAQSKWRANHAAYGTLTDVYGGQTTTPAPQQTYALTISGNTATAFLAEAAPNTASPTGVDQANDSCGTFAINQSGPVTTGTYASMSCWK